MDNKRKRTMEASPVYPMVDENLARKKLSDMIVLHKYPLSIVNHTGFISFSRSLNPYFPIVSRHQVKEDILKSFNDERTKKYNEVDSNVGRIAVTMDLWITQDEKRHFVAATAHFIDANWRRKNFLFEFRMLPIGHTEKLHMDTYIDCLCNWIFDDKLSTLTFDDCFDAEFLKETYSTMFVSDKLILGGKFLRMRCFTVTLKALVVVVLDTFRDVIAKIQESVDFWTAAPTRQAKFRSVACKLGLPFDANLTVYCENRWDSVFLMLQKALIFKDVFKDEKLSDSKYTVIPSDKDWNLTKQVCEILKLFYETATFVNTGLVANEYFEKVCGVKLALAEWATSEDEIVKCMASNMVEKFDEYWTDVNTLLAITAILDPRYKMFIVEYYFTKIYKDGAQGEIDRVKKAFSELFQEYSTKVRLGKTLDHFNVTSSGKDDFGSNLDLFVTERKRSESLITELDYYLDGDMLPRNICYFTILSWWQANGSKYPILQMIARDVLAIPVSKTASNAAVFCTVCNTLEQNFNKLSPKTIEALMCKRNWLTAEFQPGLPDAPGIVDDEDTDYDKE